MGSKNWQILRDLEVARESKDDSKISKLEALVEQSQSICEHADNNRSIVVCLKKLNTKNWGVIQRGDQILVCHSCSKILRYYPKAR
jgi:hypothetical protein